MGSTDRLAATVAGALTGCSAKPDSARHLYCLEEHPSASRTALSAFQLHLPSCEPGGGSDFEDSDSTGSLSGTQCRSTPVLPSSRFGAVVAPKQPSRQHPGGIPRQRRRVLSHVIAENGEADSSGYTQREFGARPSLSSRDSVIANEAFKMLLKESASSRQASRSRTGRRRVPHSSENTGKSTANAPIQETPLQQNGKKTGKHLPSRQDMSQGRHPTPSRQNLTCIFAHLYSILNATGNCSCLV